MLFNPGQNVYLCKTHAIKSKCLWNSISIVEHKITLHIRKSIYDKQYIHFL